MNAGNSPLLPMLPVGLGDLLRPDTDPKVMRERIHALEQAILKLPQAPLDTRHYFSKGVYVRELHIPAGIVLTGALHRDECINLCTAGDITIVTEDGWARFAAPFTGLVRAGSKKVGFTHAPTVWVTVHPNPDDERDIETLEARIIADDYDDVALIEGRPIPDLLEEA